MSENKLLETIKALMEEESLKENLSSSALRKFLDLRDLLEKQNRKIEKLEEDLVSQKKSYSDLNESFSVEQGKVASLEKELEAHEAYKEDVDRRSQQIWMREQLLSLKEKNAEDIANLSQDTLKLVFGNCRINESITTMNTHNRWDPQYDRDGNVSVYGSESHTTDNTVDKKESVEPGKLGEPSEASKNPYGPGSPGFPG